MRWHVALILGVQLLFDSFISWLSLFLFSLYLAFWLLAAAETGARSCVVSLDNFGHAVFGA
jgi:hypothetical protein